MTRRNATLYLATLVWVVLTMGIAQAQTPDPVTNAAAGFRTSHLVIDPALASFMSKGDAQALDGELAHATTPIMVAILPDSAVSGTVNSIGAEQTVYRLANLAAIPGTVGMILPQSGFFRATSSIIKPCPFGTPGCTPPGSPSGTIDGLAMAAAEAHGKQGLRSTVESFITAVQRAATAQAARANPTGTKPAPALPAPLGLILLGLAIIGGAGVWIFGRHRRQVLHAQKARELAGEHEVHDSIERSEV